jgi:superfamily II DNA or RNA helicase
MMARDPTFIFYPRDPGVIYINNWLWIPKTDLDKTWLEENLRFSPKVVDEFEPKVVDLWYETDTHWILPRKAATPKGVHIDLRPTTFAPAMFEDKINLFKEQQEAFKQLTLHKEGILNLAPGKGKTILALKRVAYDGVPTLIVVPDTGLITQWEQRIRSFLGYNKTIGRIQGQIQNWKYPITIASIKTLALYYREMPIHVRKYYGLIIFDECHRTSASTFKIALPMFWGNRVGLTATTERSDGMEGILEAHVGKPFYVDKDYGWEPKIIFLQTGTRIGTPQKHVYNNMGRTAKLVSNLVYNKERNALLEKLIKRLLDQGRKILVLTSRLKHVSFLAKDLNAAILTGKTPQSSRLDVLQNNRLVIATQKVASEGLDAVYLDTVIFATPFSFYGLFEQGAGRAMRKLPGVEKKQPMIIYLWDSAVPIIKNMGGKLMKELNAHEKRFHIISANQV